MYEFALHAHIDLLLKVINKVANAVNDKAVKLVCYIR